MCVFVCVCVCVWGNIFTGSKDEDEELEVYRGPSFGLLSGLKISVWEYFVYEWLLKP